MTNGVETKGLMSKHAYLGYVITRSVSERRDKSLQIFERHVHER